MMIFIDPVFRAWKRTGRHVLMWVLACFSLIAAAADNKDQRTILEIGVLPYVGLDELVRAYGPLASHLERNLGYPVRIVSARTYAEFLQQTLKHQYPLVITASHFARLAELDAGSIPALRPLTTYQVMILVRADSPVKQIGELRAARVSAAGLLAQSTLMGRILLSSHGLKGAGDVQMVDAGNHKNALLAVLNGEADACVVSEGAYRHMKEEDRKGLRELVPQTATNRSAIPVIYSFDPSLPVSERNRLTELIARFANEIPEGQAWIQGLKYGGLRPPTGAEMKSLDPDVAELRRVFTPDSDKR